MESGELQVYGIAPEQYPDRMALYLQWQQLDFPVLVDPLNLIEVKAVPITLLVDSSGVIRFRNPTPQQYQTFQKTEYPKQKLSPDNRTVAPVFRASSKALIDGDIDSVKSEYQKLLQSAKRFKELELPPQYKFKAGVMHRWLHDHGATENFQSAINHWKEAIEAEPSQYIWRRRIQQYGPRLDKPYPFYNWIEQARKDIIARGEMPHSLLVEPTLSERAKPLRKPEILQKKRTYPDPDNKIKTNDTYLTSSTTRVPHTSDKNAFHYHIKLLPLAGSYWSSDSQEVELWYVHRKKRIPKLLSTEATLLPPNQETSIAARYIEIDIEKDSESDLILFYSLCGKDGACRFLKTKVW